MFLSRSSASCRACLVVSLPATSTSRGIANLHYLAFSDTCMTVSRGRLLSISAACVSYRMCQIQVRKQGPTIHARTGEAFSGSTRVLPPNRRGKIRVTSTQVNEPGYLLIKEISCSPEAAPVVIVVFGQTEVYRQ